MSTWCAGVLGTGLLGILLVAIGPAARGEPSAPPRIAIRGNQFFVGDSPIFLSGVNTPWHQWDEFGKAYDHAWWDAEFQRLTAAHVNCVRIWIHCNGANSPTTDENGVVHGASDALWADMDDLFKLSAAHKLYIMPCLWSFDMAKNGDRYKKLLADPAKVQSYIDTFIVPLVKRYDGRPYLLAWEICNEPEWMSDSLGVAQPDVLRMHAMVAAAIHENSSAYVTTGSACVKWNGTTPACVGNWWSNESLIAHHPTHDPKAFLDLYQVHYYGWMDPWFGKPFDKTVSEYGVPDDRPVIIGEMPARGGAERYVQLYRNGFDGGFGWTSNDVAGTGGLAAMAPALDQFYTLYPKLVEPTAQSAGADKAGLRRSDVVFMGASSPPVYRDYGTTVVSWGDRPWGHDPKAVEDLAKRVKAARDLGIRYLPGAAFRTAFGGMIDYDPDFMDSVCRSLDGTPITVPWLWDAKHKGHPAYWCCTNSPKYRAYLKDQLEPALKLDIQGIHIDDYMGTSGTVWSAGCFCHWCMADFREYLKKHADPAELKKLGIVSLDGFDYGEFLRQRGVTADAFKNKAAGYPEQVPLSHMFLQFEDAAAVQWVIEYRRWTEEVAGHPLMLCVNSAVSGPDNLMIAPAVTFFSGEVGHEADKGKVSAEPIWSFKLGDAVGRPVACTAAGQDWAFVNANNKPGLVRTWMAQAYAFGHQFMPPVHQWCYTKEKGTHWWSPDPKEFDGLTQFVRANARLFDGYDSVAHVGLLYSDEAFREWKRGATAACSELALRNVPFRIVMAGDEWLPERLTTEDLKGLDALVYTEPTDLGPAQQKVLDGAKMAVKWPDAQDRLGQLVPQYISVVGAQGVTVVPRARRDEPSAPFVCQLVNRNYDAKSDAMEVQRDFKVRLADSLFGAGIRAAKLYAPNAEPVELKVERDGQAGVIHVPSLDVWGVLELTPLGR